MLDFFKQTTLQSFPWQDSMTQRIYSEVLSSGRSCAILLHAPLGMGLWNMAHRLAYMVMCKQPEATKACGRCEPCLSILKRMQEPLELVENALTYVHHDAIWQLQGYERTLSVEIIRNVIEQLQTRLHARQIIVMGLLENMNAYGQNALLKMIEEPYEGQRFILITHAKHHVANTILSRCQSFYVAPTHSPETLHWLNQNVKTTVTLEQLEACHGRPLTLLHQDTQLLQDWKNYLGGVLNQKIPPFSQLEKWAKHDFFELNRHWVGVIYRFVKERIEQEKYASLIRCLYGFLDDLYGLMKAVQYHQSTPKMALYSLLLQWSILKNNNVYQPLAP